ncbi:MAG: metalloregulator ArsR/SmtB family transcription factor [Phycisphaerales bacterium]|nr:metalloregulator ArsR/SmtB family transcription factor [Phycisphaerales bacterium]
MKRSPARTELTDRLAALGEQVRLRLLRLLEREELSVGELAQVFQAPQSTISRHLKLLSDGGWLVKRARGAATMYRLVLDDLPMDSRALWLTVREQMADTPELEEDLRRLAAALAERKTDSQAFFGRVAGEWDDLRNDLFGGGFTAQALLALLDPEWVVADLGCGTGNASEALAPFVRRVVAVDRSGAMLTAARKRLRGHENIEFVESGLEDLDLPARSLDAAVCVLAMHHVEDPAGALRAARRALRPGGVALVVDMVEHDRAAYRRDMGHKHLGFSRERAREMLEAAGYQRARVRELPADAGARGPSLFVATGVNPKGPDDGRLQ